MSGSRTPYLLGRYPKWEPNPSKTLQTSFLPNENSIFFLLVAHVHLLLPLYINRPITKMFPIETLLEMMDSSTKNLGEFEYDNKNCHRHQKTQVWLKNSKRGLPPLATVRKSVHNKNFPIGTLLERIDSSVRSSGEFEYDKQNCLQHQKTTARSKNR